MITHIETKTTKSTKTIPYIHELPLLGSLFKFLRKDRLDFLLRIAQGRDVCGFHMGPVPVILFNKPEYVQSILVEHGYDFSKGRLTHKAVGGNGLFVSEGEFHRHQRKLMAPLFQPRHIANYAQTIAHYGERIQQKWNDGMIIDLNAQMIGLTMSVIGKVLFDADVFDETNELSAALAVIFEYTVRKLSSPFMPPLSWPTPLNIRDRKAIQVVQNRVQRMIDERRRSGPDERRHMMILHAYPTAYRSSRKRCASTRQPQEYCERHCMTSRLMAT